MPTDVKTATAWSFVKQISANVEGVWTPVRKAFENVDGVWQQTYGDNLFLLYALGLSETLTPVTNGGLWVNGSHLITSARSYNLITFDQYGNVVFNGVYDVFGDATATPPVTTNTDALAAKLNSLAAGTLFTLFSYDEPMNGHLTADLLAAVERVGGTAGVYGQTMAYRGAYLLLGTVGSAASLEVYRGVNDGDSAGDPNAALEYSFGIWNNAFVNIAEVIGP